MVHLTHSSLYWRLGCISDTSSKEENTSPIIQSSNDLNKVIGADDIDADEVLGQYFGKVEHVSAARSDRSRNTGFRLLLDQ
ncbi:uncharacterized protein PITG_01464 [Phytophthora infestans T30-4]|uniref:Uncharacterized protein n=1 Tax=Phytophthora infestans (strain T30-4) TaxID=403677 RepID=D0MTB6_PHYIT|nr:uncharacterized protein PITG_01464 [Phytophthora infestans T30-4]EEY61213.1 conserved hypothetical protein [Phytophthora infestans T30-4]|eukprot:XP_002908130.1 conserved hypothetical protein [Phytophthora infestans T30-4]